MTDYSYLSGDERMYQAFYGAAVSPTLRRIWQDVFADEYPEEADPFGFSTTHDLLRISEELAVKPGDRFVDIGCGRGGPSLWVARRTGAAVVGLDVVPEAAGYASRLAQQTYPELLASFRTGAFEATGLPDHYADGIMSVDAFWMIHNKLAALREVSRILRNGGRLVMTSWMPDKAMFQSLVEGSGFRVLTFAPTSRWLDLQLSLYREVLHHREQISVELGPDAARVFLSEAEHAPARLGSHPRMFLVAQKFEETRLAKLQ